MIKFYSLFPGAYLLFVSGDCFIYKMYLLTCILMVAITAVIGKYLHTIKHGNNIDTH